MKKLTQKLLTLLLLMLTFNSFGQAPEGINYQATVRDNSGSLLASQSVAVIFTIKQTSAIGTTVYQESHTVNTNSYGGFNVIIGGGTASSGNFGTIDWSTGPYYLNVTINGNDLGTTQLISVPYALYAKSSGSSTPGPQGPIGPQGDAGPQGPAGNDEQDIDSLTLRGKTLTVYIKNGNGASVSLDSLTGLFQNDNGTIQQKGGYDTSNFLFGSPQMNYDGDFDHSNRMFFHKEKAAFRVGSSLTGASSTAWNEDSIGSYSFASGVNTKAIGIASTAIGNVTSATGSVSFAAGSSSIASGFSAVAMGTEDTASGNNSVAFGSRNSASGTSSISLGSLCKVSGNFSVAIGNECLATGANSTSLGYATEANGRYSTAIGFQTKANSSNSTAMGNNTYATGFISTSMGSNTQAKGDYSTAMGLGNIANVEYSTAIGRYNDTTTSATGLIFSIGNGSGASRRNSMHIFQASNNAYFRGNLYPMVDNSVSLGRSFDRWNSIYATNGTIQTSDTTLKTNIKPLLYGLTDLMKVKTISYNWKDDQRQIKKIGFNAQNLLEIIPEVVQTHSIQTDENTGDTAYVINETLGVFYSDMIPVLTKSIQEQQVIIEQEKTKNEAMNNDIVAQKAKTEALQIELDLLKKELETLKTLLLNK